MFRDRVEVFFILQEAKEVVKGEEEKKDQNLHHMCALLRCILGKTMEVEDLKVFV